MAWLRTDLALTGAAIIVARLVAIDSPAPGLLFVGVATLLGAGVAHGAAQRYRVSAQSLRDRAALPDGRLPALVVLLTLLTAAGALGIIAGS